MVSKTKEKDLKTWLIGIEQTIGEPVVVSLLIQQGKVSFINAQARALGLDDPDCDTSQGSMQDLRNLSVSAGLLDDRYIG